MNKEDTSKKIKENKYKILRMSLILGNASDDKESLDDFETAAREIDAINSEEYLDLIESKYYKTDSLDKEKERLIDLVAFIEGRVAQRTALEDDFYNVVGYQLSDLDDIRDANKLDEYKEKLNCIDRYLNNLDNIDRITKEINKCNTDLKNSYNEKENDEENNIRFEKDLSDLFKKIINDNTIILRNVEEIDKELNDINPAILESKKTLDIFDKSFRTLKKAGISGREEKEYSSYVINVKEDYYEKMERYFLLSLYRLIFVICSEFEQIYNKRNKIRKILDDRISLRESLEINEEDKLSRLYNLINSQYEDILKEEETINKISILNDKISNYEDELNKYNADNESFEITNMLNEYSVLKDEQEEKTYPDLNLDLDLEKYSINNYSENTINNNIDIEPDELDNKVEEKELKEFKNPDIEVKPEIVKDNQVVKVSEPTSIDIINVTNKTKNVMIKVGQMLNPKPEPAAVEEKIVNNIIEEKPEELNANSINEDSEIRESNESIELPSFDDLPTVSSLTNSGTINVSENNSSNTTNSFWGNDSKEFEFPDINMMEES